MRTYKNTKGKINNGSFVATPCHKKKRQCFSEAQLIFQHNTIHTRPTCVSLLVLFGVFFFSFCLGPGGRWCHWWELREIQKYEEREKQSIKLSRVLLNDVPIVLTVNIGLGRGNLTKPVGNYSIHAHKMPRLWFMALPLGHAFRLHLWLLYKLHNTITTTIVVEWPHQT